MTFGVSSPIATFTSLWLHCRDLPLPSPDIPFCFARTIFPKKSSPTWSKGELLPRRPCSPLGRRPGDRNRLPRDPISHFPGWFWMPSDQLRVGVIWIHQCSGKRRMPPRGDRHLLFMSRTYVFNRRGPAGLADNLWLPVDIYGSVRSWHIMRPFRAAMPSLPCYCDQGNKIFFSAQTIDIELLASMPIHQNVELFCSSEKLFVIFLWLQITSINFHPQSLTLPSISLYIESFLVQIYCNFSWLLRDFFRILFRS
jgi:hypothetical protein